MRSQTNIWTTHLKTDLHACGKDVQQMNLVLLMKLTADTDGTKYTQPYMHIQVDLLAKAKSAIFDAAYHSARKVAESDARQKLADMGVDATATDSFGVQSRC